MEILEMGTEIAIGSESWSLTSTTITTTEDSTIP